MLTLCGVFTLINTIQLVRRATVPVRKIPAYFVVFGATSIATFLGAGHLFEISHCGFERVMAGTFVYDYRFYSLILMGMVLLSLSIRMLREIGDWFQNVSGSQRRAITTALLIVAVSAPTAYLPQLAMYPPLPAPSHCFSFRLSSKNRRFNSRQRISPYETVPTFVRLNRNSLYPAPH